MQQEHTQSHPCEQARKVSDQRFERSHSVGCQALGCGALVGSCTDGETRCVGVMRFATERQHPGIKKETNFSNLPGRLETPRRCMVQGVGVEARRRKWGRREGLTASNSPVLHAKQYSGVYATLC